MRELWNKRFLPPDFALEADFLNNFFDAKNNT
jgi:hypothetical protein